MRISRIYLPHEGPVPNEALAITGDKAHYLRNVLRMKPGQLLHFFTPSGVQYQATVAEVGKREVQLTDIQPSSRQPQKSSIEITLIQAISASDRMDYSIQKAAELGCAKLIPVVTRFCSQKIPTHKQEKKWKHWQGVATSACEQSGRSDLMAVAPIQSFKDCLEQHPTAIFLDPTAEQGLHQIPAAMQQQAVIWIGPEGGFSPEELEQFQSLGYVGVQMGQRVLRTETVAPVIMSAMHTLYGDFQITS